jgi:hypothetical protein
MSVVSTDEKLPIANGGTNATTKGGAVANLLTETVSIANCANTSSEVTVLSVTIPANTWADGEEVRMLGVFKHKQNSGGTVNLTLKVKVGGTSYTMLSASTVSNVATEGKSARSFGFIRVGSEVWGNFNENSAGLNSSNTAGRTAQIATDQFASTSGNVWTGADFTSAVTIVFTVQWSSANSNVYFNPQVATCKKL